ncbi:hypothetical protein ACE6ED_03230 [Paenibacillus sp. CN-4]|uniref:hypothetical protein n=1 Tax=Paenibacillus nanchangensis TaxID=3348343 RepID=UPI00397855D8
MPITKKRKWTPFFFIFLLLTSCSFIEDARDDVEPNIIKLTGNYRLFQISEDINYIKGKMEQDPIKVDSFITDVGWNDDFIVYRRSITSTEMEEGVLIAETGKVIVFNRSFSLSDFLSQKNLTEDDLKMSSVKDLIDAKEKKLGRKSFTN